jgi:hypothetical protein
MEEIQKSKRAKAGIGFKITLYQKRRPQWAPFLYAIKEKAKKTAFAVWYQGLVQRYSACRANTNTGTTIDACISIYNSNAIGKCDCTCGANSFAGTASDTHISINSCSHGESSFPHQIDKHIIKAFL